jgi:hypothetical protein
MPDEAYLDLFDLDLAQYQGMTLFWDSVDGRWRATPKEQGARASTNDAPVS